MNVTLTTAKMPGTSSSSGGTGIRAQIASLQKKLAETQKAMLDIKGNDAPARRQREMLGETIQLLMAEIARLQEEATKQAQEGTDSSKKPAEKPQPLSTAIVQHISVHA